MLRELCGCLFFTLLAHAVTTGIYKNPLFYIPIGLDLLWRLWMCELLLVVEGKIISWIKPAANHDNVIRNIIAELNNVPISTASK
jgi:hypothetical protein